MIFDQITLTGSKTIKLFDLKNPLSTPYTAKTIDGLGPTDVDVTLAQTTQGTGIYVGRREQLRQITVNVAMNPDYSVGQTPETLREDIYQLRPVNTDLSLDFNLIRDDVVVAVTPVYIKKVEVTPFSKDTLLQLILASTSEFFHKKDPIVQENPMFDSIRPVFMNQGTVQTGFRMQVEFGKSVNTFGLRTNNPTTQMVVSDGEEGSGFLFHQADVLEFDTNIGNRGVWLHRSGTKTSVLENLTTESTWLSLYPGSNQLDTILHPPDPTSFTWKLLEHRPKYRGV